MIDGNRWRISISRLAIASAPRRRGTGAHPQKSGEPLPHRGVLRNGRRSYIQTDGFSPMRQHVVDRLSHLLVGRREGVIVPECPARKAADHDQRHGALGIGRGEQRAHRAAFGISEQRGAFGADLVQHRAHVIHALLERGRIRHPVGQAGAAFVEHDQAGKRCELVQEAGDARLLPEHFDVGQESGNQHQIDGPLADHLIGDRHARGPHILGLGYHLPVFQRRNAARLACRPRRSISLRPQFSNLAIDPASGAICHVASCLQRWAPDTRG